PPPHVTVQIPVYNEGRVAVGALRAAAALDYPRERLEIQVLDDSTDGTAALLAGEVARLRAAGLDVHNLRRSERVGFKAGALAHGLASARGELVAIFDADFRPPADWLRRTVPHFADPGLGALQTRWEHLNADRSLITRLQAFGLDLHFLIEQPGRSAGGFFLRFNGTAGLWRRRAIEDAGGWQFDTLTEDLDLAYRAQMAGWRVRFDDTVAAPAQLPETIQGLKIQQFRWNKGQAEAMRKLLPQLLRHPLPWPAKAQAVGHLLNSTIFLIVAATTLLSVPLLAAVHAVPRYAEYFAWIAPAGLNTVAFGLFYLLAVVRRHPSWPAALARVTLFLPLFVAVVIGISLHNAVATVLGLAGVRSPFRRTPKRALDEPAAPAPTPDDDERASRVSAVLEAAAVPTFLLGSWLGLRWGIPALVPLHLLAALGFSLVLGFRLRERTPAPDGDRDLRRSRPAQDRAPEPLRAPTSAPTSAPTRNFAAAASVRSEVASPPPHHDADAPLAAGGSRRHPT
ncbi:MAG: glycosyltransferase, partial [Gemmatimonadetes bacterium]